MEGGAGALAHIGPAIINVVWTIPEALASRLDATGRAAPPGIRGPILIDTGAQHTCIDEGVAHRLGLNPIGQRPTAGVSGTQLNDVYYATLIVPTGKRGPRIEEMGMDGQVTSVPGLYETSSDVGMIQDGAPIGFTGLLGRDLLKRMRFVYDGPAGTIRISVGLGGLDRRSSRDWRALD